MILIQYWEGHRCAAKQLAGASAASVRSAGRIGLVGPLISHPLGALAPPEGQVDAARAIAASGTYLRSHPESRVMQKSSVEICARRRFPGAATH